MNTKIFNLLQKNLQLAFNLPKYADISINADTQVQDLPWTPARYRKFKDAVEAELSLPCDYVGTLRSIVDDLSERYILRFFSEIWKPRTGDYEHTGWELADEINQLNPERVLDVGCGLSNYYEYLISKKFIGEYIGIDVSLEMLEISKLKFPKNLYMCGELEEIQAELKEVDFIVSSQTFNRKLHFSDNYEEIESFIKSAVDIARHGVAFDLMSDHVDFFEEKHFYYSPERIFQFCKKEFKKVNLFHDLEGFEFVIQIKK